MLIVLERPAFYLRHQQEAGRTQHTDLALRPAKSCDPGFWRDALNAYPGTGKLTIGRAFAGPFARCSYPLQSGLCPDGLQIRGDAKNLLKLDVTRLSADQSAEAIAAWIET